MIYEFSKIQDIIFGTYMRFMLVFSRDYRYVKSRFSPRSVIFASSASIKALAKMLRKIEHVDLTGIPLFLAKYQYGTSFCLLEDERKCILYEFEYSFGDPEVFAFVMAHEIRHYVQWRNEFIDFGEDGLECKLTKVKYKVGSQNLPAGLRYSQLPWEADANHFAFQLVDVDLNKRLNDYCDEDFLEESYHDSFKWYNV